VRSTRAKTIFALQINGLPDRRTAACWWRLKCFGLSCLRWSTRNSKWYPRGVRDGARTRHSRASLRSPTKRVSVMLAAAMGSS